MQCPAETPFQSPVFDDFDREYMNKKIRLYRKLKLGHVGFKGNPIRGRMKLGLKGAQHRPGLRDKQRIMKNSIFWIYCSALIRVDVTLPNALRQSHARESDYLQSLFQ
jgi:hypothetical protein